MKRLTAMRMLLGGFAAVLLLAGCGGGGETPQSQGPAPSGPVSMLAWTPPATYNDNAVLDPERDILHYEIYVRQQDKNFTDIDMVAVVAPLSTDGLRSLVTEFNLDAPQLSLPAGTQLYVSMRAVGVDQQKSAFMDPLVWDRS